MTRHSRAIQSATSLPLLCSLLLMGFMSLAASAQVGITELMASNTRTLRDEDGETSDWIEIRNSSSNTVDLLNWTLTDSAGSPAKWRFPSTNIAPHEFMVVFASGKDRRTPGLPLHTSFKLSAEGEYLAMARPDGSVATEIAPQFGPQFPDVSYGPSMPIATTALVATNASMVYWVPTHAVDAAWTEPLYDDSDWLSGTNGIGYETGTPDAAEASFRSRLLATQPVAYWRLDETNGTSALNSGSAGMEYEAGYQGGIELGGAGPCPPSFPTFEPNNHAPVFNGTNAWINGPFELLSDLSAFTMAGWICPTTPPNRRTGLFGQNDTLEFGFNTPTTLSLWSPAGSVTVDYPFPTNEWHHVSVVGGDGQVSIYLDGALAGTGTALGGGFGQSPYHFHIGAGIWDEAGNYFQGQMDEVAVWHRSLATLEIASLFATDAAQVSYADYLHTDLQTQMGGSNSTVYVRFPFTVDDPSTFDSLKLLLRYDDGFVAYLNGHPVARANVPADPAWDSCATQRRLDPEAVQWQEYDLQSARSYLLPGRNVLAIQALNISPTNTDFLVQAQLLAHTILHTSTGWRYLTEPTPGGPNGTSPLDEGPVIYAAGHSPNVPQPTDGLTVTARIAQALSPVADVTLHYRAMFAPEAAPIPMNDAGTDGDASAGDGIWTGTLPAGLAAPGQMIRYYVTATDTLGYGSRWPIFPDPVESQEYLGTVVADPSVQSRLPVAALFIQDPSAADTQTGTRASLFYLNELYDNLNVSIHGQSSVGWPKKSHNLAFPKDHQFLYQPNGARQKKVIFLSNYGDKARMRTALTYAVAARSGGVSPFAFPIRIQLNGSFWGVEDLVERCDDLFLERIGRDPNGALYKMYNDLSDASGNEKKTREWEGTGDLSALIASLDESLPLTDRELYAYDNLDLPQIANYFAEMAIASCQDCGSKNYYLYRDSDGTGEWSLFPWDVDLTWGRNWLDDIGSFSDTLFQSNVLSFYDPSQQVKPSNRLFDLFFASADFRQMYLRRLRTLMDTVLMPPGTPAEGLAIEPLIRRYENQLNPPDLSPSDAALDYAAWGPSWGDTNLSQFPHDVERLISVHLPGRRDFLFNSAAATLNGEAIPPAQQTNVAIVLGSWDYRPASGNQNEQYVELCNTNPCAVDVSGWRLIGGIEITLRPGTVIPAGKSLYLAADVNAFRSRATGPHAGRGLFVQGPYGGFLSTLGNTPLILENDQGALVSKNGYAGSSSSSPFTAGNLAVLRVGDGSQTLGNRGNSVFIDQFTTGGVHVGSVSIPDNAPQALIISGSASSEGALTRSDDGRLLGLAGYNLPLTNAARLGASLANSAAAAAPRALGVVDVDGNYALVGATTNQYGGNNMRAGTTDGRGHYWGAGANSGTVCFGDGSEDIVQNTVANTTVIQTLGGHLYFSTTKPAPGICKLPSLPKGPATPTLILSTGAGSAPYAFAFHPESTLAYVADDGTIPGRRGVQRWDCVDGTWTMSYAFAAITNAGVRGLAVDFGGANPVIYATTAEASLNRLVSLTDTGAEAAVSTLATAGANQLFRGVALAPDNGTVPHFFRTTLDENRFTLTWAALLNRNYTLQHTDNLCGTNWLSVTNLTSDLPVVTVTDELAPRLLEASETAAYPGTNRFYRLLLNP